MKSDGFRIKTDGCGSPYANTLIPLQRLHSLACSYRGLEFDDSQKKKSNAS